MRRLYEIFHPPHFELSTAHPPIAREPRESENDSALFDLSSRREEKKEGKREVEKKIVSEHISPCLFLFFLTKAKRIFKREKKGESASTNTHVHTYAN
jgi:hypothetical protein